MAKGSLKAVGAFADRAVWPVATGTVAGVVANQMPQNRKSSKKAKEELEHKLHKNFTPIFKSDNEFATRMYNLVMKMDEDEARVFTTFVVREVLEDTIEKNRRALQGHLDRVIKYRINKIKKAAVLTVAKSDDPSMVEFAKALSLIEKAFHWEEDEHPRASTGRFSTKVHVNPNAKKLNGRQAKGYGIPKVDEDKDYKLDDNEMAQYQQEHQQIANFLDTVAAGSTTKDHDVTMMVENKKSNKRHMVKVPGKPKAGKQGDWDPKEERVVHIEAKPAGINVGGAAFGLSGALGSPISQETVENINAGAGKKGLGALSRDWNNVVDPSNPNARVYNNVHAGSKFLGTIAPDGSHAQIAAAFGEFVGDHGAEAEKVFGPPTRRAAYRYRGTERAPDPKIMRAYESAFRAGKNRDVIRSERARQAPGGIVLTPEQRDELRARIVDMQNEVRTRKFTEANRAAEQRGETIRRTGSRFDEETGREVPTSNVVQYRDVKLSTQERQQIDAAVRQQYLGELRAEAARKPTTDAAMVNAKEVLINHLWDQERRPDKNLYGLQLDAGVTPPSEGFLIDAKGQVVAQAIGYGDDHYLPFNLKNLGALKGGEYIRTRSVGGPTSEDIYTGLMTGARSMTVISRSGTFTVDFEDDFRGGRRYNDKAARMVSRYQKLLDSVQSGQVDRMSIDPRMSDAITADVLTEMDGSPASEIRDEITRRQEEYKKNPDIADKDDRALGVMLDTQLARSNLSIPEQNEYRDQVLNEIRNEKEYKFRLNGEGYGAALKALQEQFPYYIKTNYTPARREDRASLDQDKGYVEPGRLRPSEANAGWHGTKQNQGSVQGKGNSTFLSASQTHYQRGKFYDRNAKTSRNEKTPDTTPGTEVDENGNKKAAAKDTVKGRIRERRAEVQHVDAAAAVWRPLADAASTNEEAKKAYDFLGKSEKDFRDWVAKPQGAKAFKAFVERQRNTPAIWNTFDDDLKSKIDAYFKASGKIGKVPYQDELGLDYDAKFQFDGKAFEEGADLDTINRALTVIDKKHKPMMTLGKEISELSDGELKHEIEQAAEFYRVMQDEADDDGKVAPAAVAQVIAEYHVDPNTPGIKTNMSSMKRMQSYIKALNEAKMLNENEVRKDRKKASTTDRVTNPGQSGSNRTVDDAEDTKTKDTVRSEVEAIQELVDKYNAANDPRADELQETLDRGRELLVNHEEEVLHEGAVEAWRSTSGHVLWRNTISGPVNRDQE